MNLSVDSISWSAGEKKIIKNLTFSAESHQVTGIIGPNGSGKTTLLRCMYKIYNPNTGSINIDSLSLAELSELELAKIQAAVLQERTSDFALSVFDVVLVGRIPHKKAFSAYNQEDFDIVESALEKVGMSDMVLRNFQTLSGGEKQRVIIARALAQNASVLIMDEPTNHLDIKYQIEIMELVRSLGLTILVTLHDLNLASLYCDKIIVLSEGEVYKEGSPREVISEDLIKKVFGVNADVHINSKTGTPGIMFLPNTL